ncbi:hypothetical protein [Bacillus sp. JCM 19041]|uniref:hypothetical protein n=1 Tax=Bacillus sp. JCM 19041 TaxID=1460637 RepID=UPI000AC98B1F
MVIVVTRLHLKGIRALPLFTLHTLKSIWQLKKIKGVRFSSYRKEGLLTFWTMTGWENIDAMKQFRNHGAHLEAMKVSRKLADELQYIRLETNDRPSWQECKQRYTRNTTNQLHILVPSVVHKRCIWIILN